MSCSRPHRFIEILLQVSQEHFINKKEIIQVEIAKLRIRQSALGPKLELLINKKSVSRNQQKNNEELEKEVRRLFTPLEKITIVTEDFGRKRRRWCRLLIYGAVEGVVCLNF